MRRVTTEHDLSRIFATPVASDRPMAEPGDFAALRARAGAALYERADDIARRWQAQVHVALPEEANLRSAPSREDRRPEGAALVQSLATALRADGATADDAVGLGLAFGTISFASGMMLHHMLKALDLLVAMCLFALEESVDPAGEHPMAIADGIRLARRLQRASSLSVLAAARGYTQAANEATRDQFRRLRHDMRNPLGTIRSALSLMEDETVPEEARRSPRFRAMIHRNARALDELIVARLGDAEAKSPIGAYQRISPRAIACAVRRDLRAEAEGRGVALVVQSTGAQYRLDAAGVELLLHDMLLSLLQRSQEDEVLTIEFGEQAAQRASIEVLCVPARAPLVAPEAVHRLTTMATRLGMWLELTTDRIVLSFPVVADAEKPEGSVETVVGSDRIDVGKASDDFGGPRQRENLQSGTF